MKIWKRIVEDIKIIKELSTSAIADNPSHKMSLIWESSQACHDGRVTQLRHAACLAIQHEIEEAMLGTYIRRNAFRMKLII